MIQHAKHIYKNFTITPTGIFILLLLLSCPGEAPETINDIKDNDTPAVKTYQSSTYRISPNILVSFTRPCTMTHVERNLIDRIREHTNRASLDICFYGFDSEDVISVIIESIKRGVPVRFVGNREGNSLLSEKRAPYYEGYFRVAQALDEFVPIEGKKRTNFPLDNGFDDFNLANSSGLMHNKFAIITDTEDRQHLFTGTVNCTESGFLRNDNAFLLLSDTAIAHTYREQFEFLLGISEHPITEIRHHTVDGIPIDVQFSSRNLADNNPMNNLVELVRDAKKSIHFMIFSFTHEKLINSILEANKNGITVQGIFDESQLRYSNEEYLAQAGIPVRIDSNTCIVNDHGGKLHHKTMILDYADTNAKVITGSYNWSHNSNERNDENFIIIQSQEAAEIYHKEWERIWDVGNIFSPANNGSDADYQDVIINEVMWMGSRAEFSTSSPEDEFIELKNMSGERIILDGWIIDGAATGGSLILNGYIDPDKLLVIQRKPVDESAFQPSQYRLSSFLEIANTELALVLRDASGDPIDYAGNGSLDGDFSGAEGNIDGELKKSMARNVVPGDGRDRANWHNTNIHLNINSSNYYSTYTFATPGSENEFSLVDIQPLDLVISEVAWAGTDINTSDEWIELFNNTDCDIDLDDWQLLGYNDSGLSITIELSGIIPAGKHYLLERTNDDSVPGIETDLTFTGGLNNDGMTLILLFRGTEIDRLDMLETDGGWAAGSSKPKTSMERIEYMAPADNLNWKDGDGDIKGAENSQNECICSKEF